MADKKGSGSGKTVDLNESHAPKTTDGKNLVSSKKSAAPLTTTQGKEGASARPQTTGEGNSENVANAKASPEPKKPTR